MWNHLNKLSVPFQQKAPCEIWWKLLKRFQRRNLKNHNFMHVYSLGARTYQHFPTYKFMGAQIWSSHKTVKGQPMTIIWTNLVDLESPMLYTKIQPQSFLGAGEEDLFVFLPYMCAWGQLYYRTETTWTNFQSPFNRKLHMKFEENLPGGFRGEVVERCRWITDGNWS